MYRPLVQPFFANTRGQKISPGLTVLATGGPKQRGDLAVVNPNLLRNAQGWDLGDGVVPRDGHILVENLTDTGLRVFLLQSMVPAPQAGDVYRVRLVLDAYDAASGSLAVAIAGNPILSPEEEISAPNVYNFNYNVDSVLSDGFILYMFNPVGMSFQLSFAGVYLVSRGP